MNQDSFVNTCSQVRMTRDSWSELSIKTTLGNDRPVVIVMRRTTRGHVIEMTSLGLNLGVHNREVSTEQRYPIRYILHGIDTEVEVLVLSPRPLG
jgi:hypothetical protein